MVRDVAKELSKHILLDISGSETELDKTVVERIELPANDGSDYLNLRGEVLPVIRLRELLNFVDPAPRRQNVVVVQFAGERASLVVDRR